MKNHGDSVISGRCTWVRSADFFMEGHDFGLITPTCWGLSSGLVNSNLKASSRSFSLENIIMITLISPPPTYNYAYNQLPKNQEIRFLQINSQLRTTKFVLDPCNLFSWFCCSFSSHFAHKNFYFCFVLFFLKIIEIMLMACFIQLLCCDFNLL